jgi:TPR repeat protein
MRIELIRLQVAVCLCLALGHPVTARQDWIEVKSGNFTVMSNAGERNTRTLVWQLEQIRNVMVTLWPWAKPDLTKPLRVIAAKDENAMRALVPQYWEQRGGIKPASVWTSGADHHYLAIRGDLDVESQGNVNPHITAYFSYIHLVMDQSLSGDIPLWLTRGFSAVLSNSLIRDNEIIVGAPIPWHLEQLREGTRTPLAQLLTITRSSQDFKRAEKHEQFDAQTWAFVHFLMFGERGARSGKLNEFAALVSAGKDPVASFTQTLGSTQALELPFRMYLDQRVFLVHRFKIDVNVARERFPVRAIPPAESAGLRALFHTATNRPVEARAAIAAARKADGKAAGSFEAEGLLLDQEDQSDAARTALTQAVDAGSTNAYVHYRLASLIWRPDPDRATLEKIEGLLARATAINPRYADAYSWLGEIRASLGVGEPMGLVMRAVSLEPAEAVHRIRGAFVLARQQKFDEAEQAARVGLKLADSDDQRRRAQELVDWIARLKSAATRPAAGAPASTAGASGSSSAGAPAAASGDPSVRCQSGDDTACAEVLPDAEAACQKKQANACGFAGSVYERGRGVPADRTKAAALYQQACDGDAIEGCTQLAVILSGSGKAEDLPRARQLLSKACEAKSTRACALQKSMPK